MNGESDGGKDKVAAKEQRLFQRILGLFLVLYGFLMLSQPVQYGLGLQENLARFVGIIIVFAGIYLAIKK